MSQQDRMNTALAAIDVVNYALDIPVPVSRENIPTMMTNLKLWANHLPALCMYAIMLLEKIGDSDPPPCDDPRYTKALEVVMKRLENNLRTAVKGGDPDPSSSAWPEWISDPGHLRANRMFITSRNPEYYRDRDWFQYIKDELED